MRFLRQLKVKQHQAKLPTDRAPSSSSPQQMDKEPREEQKTWSVLEVRKPSEMFPKPAKLQKVVARTFRKEHLTVFFLPGTSH